MGARKACHPVTFSVVNRTKRSRYLIKLQRKKERKKEGDKLSWNVHFQSNKMKVKDFVPV